MEFRNFNRRDFVKGSLSTLALGALPSRFAFGQATGTRLEWNDFRASPDYSSFVNAIRIMRANTNASDRRSWLYWSNIHVNSCPHGVAYFLAWHRGYLHYFQETLRMVSGNSALMVPYWDYYQNPVMPTDFTDPSCDNPLYVTGRVNTNVYPALTLQPFESGFRNFQRGTTSSFEVQIEYKPHGIFHNVVGGTMARLDAPLDPIFWVHHGQIDRLWSAWVAAGAGRTMPPSTDPYWSGSFTYTPELIIARNQLIGTSTLGYRYQNETMPTSLPPQARSASRTRTAQSPLPGIVRVQMQNGPGRGALRRPPVGRFALSGPRSIGANRRSIGGARQIPLDENSVSAQIPIEPTDSNALQVIADRTLALPYGRSQAAGAYTSVQVVVDNARVTSVGAGGGYFYDVYLNLPESGDSNQQRLLLGGFGPFEIAAAQHHPGSARLVFPATQALQNLTSRQIRDLTVSFVRVSGTNSPRGQAIVLGELRVELSNDPIE